MKITAPRPMSDDFDKAKKLVDGIPLEGQFVIEITEAVDIKGSRGERVRSA